MEMETFFVTLFACASFGGVSGRVLRLVEYGGLITDVWGIGVDSRVRGRVS